MYIEIVDNSLKIIGNKPIELNIDISYKTNESLFETIKIEDGIAHNLKFHQDRVDRSFKEYYNTKSNLNLEKVLTNLPKSGLYRAKVIYNQNGLISKEYYIYSKKIVKRVALIEIKNFDYNYKYLDREFFNKLPKIADDIIITQNGYLKDTTIANIALFHNKYKIWHTPQQPLLAGTTRESYLKRKNITKQNIHYKDLKKYSRIALLNAMVDFYIL